MRIGTDGLARGFGVQRSLLAGLEGQRSSVASRAAMNAIARSREEQFQRELHIRQIAGANRGAADRKAARAHFESARRAQKLVATRRLKHTAAPAAAPSGPRDLFDATATIGITAAVAKEVATERAEHKTIMIDATYLKAHRTASSLRVKKGGANARSGEPKAV